MKEIIRKIIINNKQAYQVLSSHGYLDYVIELTSFLDKIYVDVPWSQRLWHIKNDIYNYVKCKVCDDKIASFSRNRNRPIYLCCSAECRSKIRYVNHTQTCTEKYGVTHKSKLENNKNVQRAFNKNKYLIRINSIISDGYDLVKLYDDNSIELRHKCCDATFVLSYLSYYGRVKKQIGLCTKCFPYKYGKMESNVYEFIKSIYHGVIVRNDRKLLSGRELDFYLPEIKLAFEFNGTRHHMDCDFYDYTDISPITKKSALETWEYDVRKANDCFRLNIELIHLWEENWKKDKGKICKELIVRMIFLYTNMYGVKMKLSEDILDNFLITTNN